MPGAGISSSTRKSCSYFHFSDWDDSHTTSIRYSNSCCCAGPVLPSPLEFSLFCYCMNWPRDREGKKCVQGYNPIALRSNAASPGTEGKATLLTHCVLHSTGEAHSKTETKPACGKPA